MKITLITVTYNSASTIKDCISSIYNQTYEDIEHIVIDGASKDNTVEIIKSIPNRVVKLISEPDKGIYDAMNKGISHASGEVVGILNSDDFYRENNVIENIMKLFQKQKTDCIFANINYVHPINVDRIVRKWISGPYGSKDFNKGWHPPHPAFFVKNEYFKIYGDYDLSFKLAADFELMLRFLEKYKLSNYYYPESIVNMRLGGVTNRNLRNIFDQNIECYKAFKKNQLKVSILYPLFRLLPKIKQFFN